MRASIIVASVLLAMCLLVGTAEASGCRYKGKTYRVGQSFKDDCNTCKCNRGGDVSCTRMACAPKGCTYKGKRYSVGESFKDACNTCTCNRGGNVGCTRMACRG